MVEEFYLQACGSSWGRWLLVLFLVDKCLETLLGELARRQKIPSGSVLGLTFLGIVLISCWLYRIAKIFNPTSKGK